MLYGHHIVSVSVTQVTDLARFRIDLPGPLYPCARCSFLLLLPPFVVRAGVLRPSPLIRKANLYHHPTRLDFCP